MTHYTLGALSLYAVLVSLAASLLWSGLWSACGAVIRAGEYAQVCEVIIWVDGNE